MLQRLPKKLVTVITLYKVSRMDPVRNPFLPGAGTQPPALVGREDVLRKADIALDRLLIGRGSKSLLMVGLRGVGKTVLLNRIQELADEKYYKTILLEAPENKSLPALLIPALRSILLKLDRGENISEHVKRAIRVLKSFAGGVKVKVNEVEFGLDIVPERGTADSGDLESDLSELFVAIGEAAKSRHTAFSIMIDEMQYISDVELSALIMAIHKISQKQLPIILVGAGLPQLVAATGRSKSYAERLFDFPDIGQLREKEAYAALQEPVQKEGISFDRDALKEIFAQTRGYPYFLQEWGYHCWNAAEKSPITAEVVKAATPGAIASLDANFFRVRFDRLTPREKTYLRAMAESGPGPHRSGDIADLLDVKVKSVAPLRSGLIKKGMIYSPAHGDTSFTVPMFDEYLKRMIPMYKKDLTAKDWFISFKAADKKFLLDNNILTAWLSAKSGGSAESNE